MVTNILSVLSVILFCLCCRQLLKAVVKPIPLLKIERTYARPALWLSKGYHVVSWGALTLTFLLGLVMSFYQVYTQL